MVNQKRWNLQINVGPDEFHDKINVTLKMGHYCITDSSFKNLFRPYHIAGLQPLIQNICSLS